MDRRFAYKLQDRFDRLEETGVTTISMTEVLRWWNRQRITKSIWEDLVARLRERFPETTLSIGVDADGVAIVETDPDWLQPVDQFLSRY